MKAPQAVKYTEYRSNGYQTQIPFPDGSRLRKALLTKDAKQAARVMTLLNPLISRIKTGEVSKDDLCSHIDDLINPTHEQRTSSKVISNQAVIACTPEPDKYLSLADAWELCQHIKGTGNSKPLRGKKVTGAWSRNVATSIFW